MTAAMARSSGESTRGRTKSLKTSNALFTTYRLREPAREKATLRDFTHVINRNALSSRLVQLWNTLISRLFRLASKITRLPVGAWMESSMMTSSTNSAPAMAQRSSTLPSTLDPPRVLVEETFDHEPSCLFVQGIRDLLPTFPAPRSAIFTPTPDARRRSTRPRFQKRQPLRATIFRAAPPQTIKRGMLRTPEA